MIWSIIILIGLFLLGAAFYFGRKADKADSIQQGIEIRKNAIYLSFSATAVFIISFFFIGM